MTIRKWHETVGLEKIEETEVQEVSHDADVAPEVEAVLKMNASISVLRVILPQCLECSEFNSGGITVLGDGANHFNSDSFVAFPIDGLNDFSKSALAKKPPNCI